jgi:hypothetical protein
VLSETLSKRDVSIREGYMVGPHAAKNSRVRTGRPPHPYRSCRRRQSRRLAARSITSSPACPLHAAGKRRSVKSFVFHPVILEFQVTLSHSEVQILSHSSKHLDNIMSHFSFQACFHVFLDFFVFKSVIPVFQGNIKSFSMKTVRHFLVPVILSVFIRHC